MTRRSVLASDAVCHLADGVKVSGVCREDALKKSEEMLESDAVKFDQFLRENEAKVNGSIKRAEAEAKRRADKQIEMKRLHGRIAAMRSEVRRCTCRRIGCIHVAYWLFSGVVFYSWGSWQCRSSAN
jgi:Domain of unknown function (DUF4200)